MKPVFGTPTGTGVLPTGGIATQTPTAKISGKGRVALMLVDQDEAARVGQTLDAPHRRDAAEGGQQHREDLGQLMGACDAAILGDLGDEDPLGLDLFDAGVA